jgi:DNA-directed RNA polymerase specialized sigma24 family protein
VAESPAELPFPLTQRSVVVAVRSRDPEERARAFDAIVAVYWRPAHRCLRMRWGASDEDAEDLAQGFFAHALEKGVFARFDPARGRFRTYLLTCLDGYAANERRASQRLKRGGGATVIPLDREDGAGMEESAAGADLDTYFEREWARSLFSLAVEALRQRCRGTRHETAFRLFEAYDLEGTDAGNQPDYASLAAAHGIPVTQVTNLLAWARREFRAIVLAKLRELTASEEEFRAEARSLLGLDPP